MKYELRIEFRELNQLESLIKSSYFEDGNNGKLIGKKGYVTINNEDPLFIIFKGLNQITVKLTNDDIIDGIMRCVVEEYPEEIKLYPINNYCIVEDKKYSFY